MSCLPSEILLALCLALPCSPAPAAGGRPAVTVPDPGRALVRYRNSHATAIACVVDLHGLRKPNESDRLLIATAAVFAEFCECSKPGKPIAWRVVEGLEQVLDSRGYRASIAERARFSPGPDEVADLDEYTREIRKGRPVILTFCYDANAKASLHEASRRVEDCTSMVGIGYVEVEGQTCLICHDGLPQGQTDPSDVDRVAPEDLGLAGDGPWSEPGTSLYRWDGMYINLVMVFVEEPTPIQ